MLTGGDGEKPDSSLESLPALFSYDVCYLTRDQGFPVGKNYTSQGQAMSVARAEGSAGCAARFRQDFEDKVGLLGIGATEGVPRSSRWSWATCSEGGGQIQSSRVSPGVSLPGLGGFAWIREGFVRLQCQTSVYPQKPFYFLIVSEISSWRLSLQTWPVGGNRLFIHSLCFTAWRGGEVDEGRAEGFFCLTLKRYPLLFVCSQLILLAGRRGGFPARAGEGGGSRQWLPWCESIGNNTRPP